MSFDKITENRAAHTQLERMMQQREIDMLRAEMHVQRQMFEMHRNVSPSSGFNHVRDMHNYFQSPMYHSPPPLPLPIPGKWYAPNVYPDDYDYYSKGFLCLELHGIGRIFSINTAHKVHVHADVSDVPG